MENFWKNYVASLKSKTTFYAYNRYAYSKKYDAAAICYFSMGFDMFKTMVL